MNFWPKPTSNPGNILRTTTFLEPRLVQSFFWKLVIVRFVRLLLSTTSLTVLQISSETDYSRWVFGLSSSAGLRYNVPIPVVITQLKQENVASQRSVISEDPLVESSEDEESDTEDEELPTPDVQQTQGSNNLGNVQIVASARQGKIAIKPKVRLFA